MQHHMQSHLQMVPVIRTYKLAVISALQVVVHVMGSFQVYAMPVFDMIETLLVKNGFSNALPYRLLCRSAYVIAVGFFAITLPFFGSLLGFLGAFY